MLEKLLIIFACVFGATQSWEIKASDNHVARKLSVNVTISCIYGGNHNKSPKLSQITRIRLMKYQSNKKWTTFAKISDSDTEVDTSLIHVQATGKADKVNNSFLELVFDIASDDTLGKFMCEIDGYDQNDELLVMKTSYIVISERGISYDDILDILVNIKKDQKHDHADDQLRLGLLEKLIRSIEKKGLTRDKVIGRLNNRLNNLSKDFVRVTDDIMKRQKQLLEGIKTIENINSLQTQAWPEGMYTLPNTTSGCPNSEVFDWLASSVKITTQLGVTNNDATSKTLHMTEPVLEHNKQNNYHYVNMNLCSKSNTAAGPAWPKGAYCIQSYSNVAQTKCPVNFNSGTITFDRYNAPGTDAIVNLPNRVINSDITILAYCCRNDGDATHPILLPAMEPFYLYRFGGKCQEVIGMDVSDEWLAFNTLGAKDKYTTVYHPDGRLNGVRLDLCYYKPRK